MAFKTYIHSDIEALADRLCSILQAQPQPDAFARDYIVVQSRGMEQWLKYRIAKANGICAMKGFPFPEGFLNMFFNNGADADSMQQKNAFTCEIITWTIFSKLPGLILDEEANGTNLFSGICKYIEFSNKADSLKFNEAKLLQLSEKLSEVYYKYLAYRPECLLYWEGSSELAAAIPESFRKKQWQGELWKEVSQSLGGQHLPRIAYNMIVRKSLSLNPENLIKRAFIFGISSMPPFYLEMFLELSNYMDIHFFYRNICREDWEFNLSEKEQLRLFMTPDRHDEISQPANELLASMAAGEREFFSLLLSKGLIDSEDALEENKTCETQISLLRSIQEDILSMSQPQNPISLERNDDSVQFHSFHSRMREVESLHNCLLNFMDASDGRIKPHDIIVMTPDIQKYAPLIETVFSSKKKTDTYIHYTISDRHIRETNIEAETFLKILHSVKSRFKVSEIMSILSVESVYSKFGLESDDLELIRKWLRECSVNWGIDAGQRQETAGEECSFDENSWKTGLDMMLLGYSMLPDREDKLNSLLEAPEGVYHLPYEEIEGSNAAILGKLMAFTDILFRLAETFSRPGTPLEWKAELMNTIDSFFAETEDNAQRIDSLYASVNMMFDNIETSGFSGKIDIETVSSYLENHLTEKFPSLNFLRGGITFCKFAPMRSIPAKVICMIGMDDDVFPGSDTLQEFDLMKNNRKNSDPSKRNEGRYMFLEALLSAREKLYISHIGRSVTNNTAMFPSVVISELKEYINKNYTFSDSADADANCKTSDFISVEHPLHSFNKKYFDNSSAPNRNIQLVNYSSLNCEISKMLASGKIARKPFVIDFSTHLPESKKSSLTLEELVNFYLNPSKYILKEVLGINLEAGKRNELNDCEPIEIGGLEKYSLNQELLDLVGLEEQNREILSGKKSCSLLKAKGLIPPGRWGDSELSEKLPDVINFIEKIKEFISSGSISYPENISVGKPPGTELTMSFHNLFEKGQVFYRLASEKTKDLIRAWIYHVGLSASNYNGSKDTYLITSGGKIRHFSKIAKDEAFNILCTMIADLHYGSCVPLPFFPDTSRGIVDKKSGKPLAQWKGNDFIHTKGESDDEYIKACFGSEMPPLGLMEKYARDFYLPMLNSLGESVND